MEGVPVGRVEPGEDFWYEKGGREGGREGGVYTWLGYESTKIRAKH